MYLLDSDYLIYFLNGKKDIVNTISSLADHGLSTSIINIAEVLEGLHVTADTKKAGAFKDFVRTIEILYVTDEVAETFAKIRADLRRHGNLIDNLDLFIAATCITNNHTLVTGNKVHFERVPGLQIHNEPFS